MPMKEKPRSFGVSGSVTLFVKVDLVLQLTTPPISEASGRLKSGFRIIRPGALAKPASLLGPPQDAWRVFEVS
jgi:hypothetical protein